MGLGLGFRVYGFRVWGPTVDGINPALPIIRNNTITPIV